MDKTEFPLREFDADTIRVVVIQEMEKIFAYKSYETIDKGVLISRLVDRVLSKIAPEGKGPLKYVTHVTIFPKSFGPIDSFSNNFWDPDTDGLTVVDYENSNLHVSFVIWGVKTDN